MQLKEQQKLEKELNGYVEWICRAEDLVLAEERTTEADKVLIMEARQKAAAKMRKLNIKGRKQDSVETDSVEHEGKTDDLFRTPSEECNVFRIYVSLCVFSKYIIKVFCLFTNETYTCIQTRFRCIHLSP